MKLIDLWPTRIVVDTIPMNICANTYSKYAEVGSKDYELILDDEMESYILNMCADAYGGKYEICDGWIRTLTTSDHNGFELHCDSHYGNQLVAVIQLFGNESSGGAIKLYDPSWKNPQWMSDEVNPNSNVYNVDFKVSQIVIFPSNVWHSVDAYYGKSNRTTLNLMIQRTA